MIVRLKPFRFTNGMNSEIYYMCVAILSVWQKSTLKKCYGISVVNKDDEIYKIFSPLKSKFLNDIEFIFHIFNNNYVFADTSMYLTFVPSVNFVMAAKQKKVKKIVCLPKINQDYNSDLVVESFSGNFGKVVDLLSSYK